MRRIPQHERESQIRDIASRNDFEFVGWVDGYKNKDSKFIMKCKIHGTWTPNICNLSRNEKCPQCHIESTRTNDIEKKISISLPSHIKFLKFKTSYKNQNSKIILECSIHGVYEKTLSDVINKNSYCKGCGIKSRAKTKSNTKLKNLQLIQNKCTKHNYTFIGFRGDGSGSRALIEINCKRHGPWVTNVHNFLSSSNGCPSCGRHGYIQEKDGFLYLLRSNCGKLMKIGITNNPEVRLNELKYFTPFPFSIVNITSGNGRDIMKKERELHAMFNNAKLSGFNGATEWFLWNEISVGLLHDPSSHSSPVS